MKTYFLILTAILSSFTLTSCNNDDDNASIQPDNHPIVGKWSLIYISIPGSWSPPETFGVNDIIWNFNTNNEMTVTIAEGVTPHQSDYFTSQYYGLNYTYSINDSEVMLISSIYPDNPSLKNYSIENDTLKLIAGSMADDSYSEYRFVKLTH